MVHQTYFNTCSIKIVVKRYWQYHCDQFLNSDGITLREEEEGEGGLSNLPCTGSRTSFLTINISSLNLPLYKHIHFDILRLNQHQHHCLYMCLLSVPATFTATITPTTPPQEP